MRKPESFGCGKYSVVGALKGKPGKFGYMCLFCGSYRCNRCRNPKLKKVRSAIARISSEKKLNKLATLTLDRKLIKKGQRSDRCIRKCWSKMRVSLARKVGEMVDYVGVLEFHKDGVARLHLLVNPFIKQDCRSDAWSGVVVDIRRVDMHRATT